MFWDNWTIQENMLHIICPGSYARVVNRLRLDDLGADTTPLAQSRQPLHLQPDFQQSAPSYHRIESWVLTMCKDTSACTNHITNRSQAYSITIRLWIHSKFTIHDAAHEPEVPTVCNPPDSRRPPLFCQGTRTFIKSIDPLIFRCKQKINGTG